MAMSNEEVDDVVVAVNASLCFARMEANLLSPSTLNAAEIPGPGLSPFDLSSSSISLLSE